MKLREEEFYEQYHQHGGTTIIPTEIFNELYDDATEEIERLKEEYMILQNASDEVEEKKDREIERLNNIIVKLKKVLWQRCEEAKKNEQYVRLNCYKDILNELTYLLMQGSDKE